jgi:ATP-dependent exoDNAse (exonuclease V) alpha subunit
VRITRNDKDLDLANGDRLHVVAVSAGRVTLSDGARNIALSTEKPLHIDHAYATTVHSSQGLTADRVLIDADAASRTTARDVYYVAVSRARHEARIFTNDRAKLPAAVMRETVKTAALDVVKLGTRQHSHRMRIRERA